MIVVGLLAANSLIESLHIKNQCLPFVNKFWIFRHVFSFLGNPVCFVFQIFILEVTLGRCDSTFRFLGPKVRGLGSKIIYCDWTVAE